MSPSDAPKLRLEVTAADSATELYLIDGDFSLLDRGVGARTFEVTPGIYKIKARAGLQQEERLVVVRTNTKVHFEPLAFSSPVPLQTTTPTTPQHVAASHRVVDHVHVPAGAGSSLTIVGHARTANCDPLEGLRLRRMDGSDLTDVALAAEGSREERCRLLHIAVDPGGYRLALQLRDGRVTEQTIFTCSGWQTRIYLLTGADRAELAHAAISMRREGVPFDANDTDTRLEEIARQALVHGRKVLSDDLRSRILEPDVSPMLALMGMHLLIREAKRNKEKRAANPEDKIEVIDSVAPVRAIVGNLRVAIGKHPDVEAIAIGAGVADPSWSFDVPPMLTLSWRLLIKATVQRPELIPRGSFGDRIATRLWGGGAWLQWIDPDTDPAKDRDQVWQENARRLLTERIPIPTTTDTTSALPSLPPERPFAVGTWLTGLVERFVKKHPEHAAMADIVKKGVAESREAVFDVERIRLKLDPDRKRALVKHLGIPMATVEAWLQSLDEKK
jgi:hypothetical protein